MAPANRQSTRSNKVEEQKRSSHNRESVEQDKSQKSIASIFSKQVSEIATPLQASKASPQQAESSMVSHKFEVETELDRLIILIDMDAYYAQVEMKKHGIKES